MLLQTSSISSAVVVAPFTTTYNAANSSRLGFSKKLHISTIVSSATSTAQRTFTGINTQKKKNLYLVLGVDRRATQQEIKSSFRRLARSLHPDVLHNNNENRDGENEEFMSVKEAYEVLSDPCSRSQYDRLLSITSSPSPSSSFSFDYQSRGFNASQPRSNWETDQCW